MSTAAIILAAGFSRRLGRPKQHLVLHGETLLQRAVRIAREAELAPIFIVVRENDPQTDGLAETGCEIVLNSEAAEGIGSSIRAGVHGVQLTGSTSAIILTCDQIALTPDHLRALCEHPETITGSLYAGGIRVPAYFPASAFSDLQQLTGDSGARDLLRNARGIPAEDLALDIDTEADYQRALAASEQSSS